jgi:single-stranded DNA-binding protein
MGLLATITAFGGLGRKGDGNSFEIVTGKYGDILTFDICLSSYTPDKGEIAFWLPCSTYQENQTPFNFFQKTNPTPGSKVFVSGAMNVNRFISKKHGGKVERIKLDCNYIRFANIDPREKREGNSQHDDPQQGYSSNNQQQGYRSNTQQPVSRQANTQATEKLIEDDIPF